MRWVLITPLGMPVEPEVSGAWQIVSDVIDASAAASYSFGVVASELARLKPQ